MPFDMEPSLRDSGSAEPLDFALLLADDNFDAASGFAPSNHNSGFMSTTVSPQDLFLDHDLSAPHSNALTDLTTPSLYDDSPYDVSPAFEAANFGQHEWTPLFNDNFLTGSYNNTVEPPSLTASMISLASNAEDMLRTPSGFDSPDDQCTTDVLHRLSSAAGISKSSRRTLKDLPPIEVDEEDERAVKRARNTLAARKSRQKKRDTEDMLRIALEAMTAERDNWKMIAIQHGAPIPKPRTLSE